MDILENPSVPDGLREAAARGTLVPFIGAGASRIAGSPGWEGFADQVLLQLVRSDALTYREVEQFKHESPRTKLSIAKSVAQRKPGIHIDYKSILHPESAAKKKGRRLYSEISRLSNVFVTTNYDSWLDRKYDGPEYDAPASDGSAADSTGRRVICRSEDFLASFLPPTRHEAVMHLHGSVDDPDSMILTTRDYMMHYASDRKARTADEESRLLTFLDVLFRDNTVLFIGYSLAELEILEYVLLKARHAQSGGSLEARHYLLSGFFSHEHDLALTMRDYWLTNTGIELIAFSRDRKNWDQLIDVCEHFADEIIGVRGAPGLERKIRMEGLLDE